MQHVDAFSHAIDILVVEDNPFEANLILSQSCDPPLIKLKRCLEKQENRFFEMRNGLVYRKQNNDLVFYVPDGPFFSRENV